MLPIRAGPTTVGVAAVGDGVAAGTGVPEEIGGAPGTDPGAAVALKVAVIPVSHICPGITIEMSRRTPDQATSPSIAWAVSASLAETVALRSTNCWSWPILPCRSALMACWARSFWLVFDRRA